MHCDKRKHPFLSLTLTIVSLVLLSSPGTSGISLSHNFYSGSIFKSNSIRTSLSPQRLPPQWLEFTRFYNCGSRVSTNHLFFQALATWGWECSGDVRHSCPLCSSNTIWWEMKLLFGNRDNIARLLDKVNCLNVLSCKEMSLFVNLYEY